MAAVTIRVIRDTDNNLPTYETADSAGMDLRAHLSEGTLTLRPGERALVPTGLRVEIPSGCECQVRPRSGLAVKRGLSVLNAPGTIDADYRGDVGVILINHSDEDQCIIHGDRIAQLVFASVTQADLVEVEELGDTTRSASGLGSTGDR